MNRKYIIGAILIPLAILVGLPRFDPRTGTLYSDTRTTLKGPGYLINGAAMWGEGPHRGLFSTMVGSFLTLRLVLFSWWWDTLCIPYDIYLQSDGVDIHVYDQDGNPVPGVMITAYGCESFHGMEQRTDEKGRLYYPRRVYGFTSFTAMKEGYWGFRSHGTLWLSQHASIGLPQMLRREFNDRAIDIPTDNGLHELNIYMKKVPRNMPIAARWSIEVTNVTVGVEYAIDLSSAELCPPFGPGNNADMRFCIPTDESKSRQWGRSSIIFDSPMMLQLNDDGCENWPYLYYEPPASAFESGKEPSDGWKSPVLVKLSNGAKGKRRYSFVVSAYREDPWRQDPPICVLFQYWNVDVADDGVMVCDCWGGEEKKVIAPTLNDTNLEPKREAVKQRRR